MHKNFSALLLTILFQIWIRSLVSAESAIQLLDQMKISSNFKDPLVWDMNSLYKTDRKSNIKKQHQDISRQKRSTGSSNAPLVDVCQSKMEILTPYYATNSQGKVRTIVNSERMQQAIQVETCIRSSSTGQNAAKCNAQMDCGCEQKYKWHRLLVLDPRESGASRGLFMDWFLFPSSCVCRCSSSQQPASKQFLSAIRRPEA